MTQLQKTDRSRGRAAVRFRYASKLWHQYLVKSPLAPLDRWLAVELRQYPQFGSRDRRAYGEILFAAARFAYLAAFIDFFRQQLPDDPAPDEAGLCAAMTAFSERHGSAGAAVDVVRQLPAQTLFHVAGQRYALENDGGWPLAGLEPEADEAQLDRLLALLLRFRSDNREIKADLLWQGIPLWFAGPLEQRASRSNWEAAERQAFLGAQAKQPPLWLRLNHVERREDVLRELAEHGLDAAAQGPAIQVHAARNIQSLRMFQSGAVEIQDWASQEIGHAVAAKPGELVWDACAGAGGKTVQLASALADTGILYASDVRPRQLEEARRRVARAGYDTLRTLVWDGDELPAFGPEVAAQQGFDRVLVDAPCSSSGVWRRNPDARFRTSAEALPGFQELQLRLLSNAAAAVRVGGRLVYGTCSWLVEENEELVERFLARQPEFELERMALHGSPAVDADTMFSAVMRRSA
jgi:16S rRNA (cytosine967-C5)-methyltransferase